MAGERRSGLMLLKGSDERKVNVSVEDGRPLGIMVRGGNEFGLGIYITGVDIGSDAEQAELKLGDQILDVNGQSFLDISHTDAVKVLKSTKHLMMTVKDVGKLPHSRTTYDQAQWVKHKTPSRRPLSTRSTPAHKARPNRASVFSRGAGSQLMLSTVANQQTFMGLIQEKAVHLLNRSELQTLTYYLEEYQQGHVTIDGLARALRQLLNTTAKFSLVADVRAIVTAQDLDKFDSLLSKKSSTNLRKARSAEIVFQGPPSDQSLDSGASSRVSSLESAKVADGDMGRLHIAIRQMSNESEDFPDTLPEAPTLHPAPGTSYQGVTMAEVHRIPERNGAESGASANSPSEDSGVEMNGHGERQTSSRNNLVYHNRGPSKFHKGKSTPKRDNRTLPEGSGWVDLREQSRRLTVQDSERLSQPLSVKVHNGNLPDMQSRPATSQNTSLRNPVGLLSIASATAGVNTAYSKHQPEAVVSKTYSKHQPDSGVSKTYSKHQPEDDLSSAQSSPNSISQRIERYQQAAAASFKPDAVITKPVRPPRPSRPQNTVTKNKYEHNWASLSKITSPSTPDTREGESVVNSDSMRPGTKLVRVQKTKPTLGLAIEGGANTRQPLPRIIKVQPGGSANDTGELKIGHVILEVNGKSLDGLEHKMAARTIAAAFKDSNTDYIELLVTEPSHKVTV